ncbi:hypothetical protein G9A89_022800 [Geosiphon pyriformis]|nr:hypothetical protein G9A89_022800 [Geosiphon pyriformis]
MSATIYLQYSYISKFWVKAVRDDVVAKKIEAFFAPGNFFNSHSGTEFFLGTSPIDGRRYLLVSVEAVKIIQKELESYLLKSFDTVPVVQNIKYDNVEVTFIDSPTIFNKVNKEIQKFNKTVRADAKLRTLIQSLERAQAMHQEKKYLFVAVDIESYEKDHSCILEVGWSMYNAQTDLFMDRHFCVTEYRHLKNGQFVPDMKDRFTFGKTVWESLKTISTEILKDLTEDNDGNVVFVGHDIKMDIKYLESMGVKVQEVIKPLELFDTAEMNAARVGRPHERINLGRLLDQLHIENYCLHNAGNLEDFL